MTAKERNYENLAESIIAKLAQRNMEGYYCKDREEANAKVKRFLMPDCSISWGGSETLEQIGLIADLKESENEYEILYRKNPDPALSAKEFYGKMVTADFFLMSTNAITVDGELINIDGNGNRVACLCNGPDHVIIVAGMNKIVPDIQSGIARVRNIAAPPNGVRLNTNTPCAEYGRCVDCLTDDCMCCHTIVTRMCRVPGRIKVILVGEELGY